LGRCGHSLKGAFGNTQHLRERPKQNLGARIIYPFINSAGEIRRALTLWIGERPLLVRSADIEGHDGVVKALEREFAGGLGCGQSLDGGVHLAINQNLTVRRFSA